MAQKSFVAPNGLRLLDWTNIGNSTGIGGLADQMFVQVQKFLGGSHGTSSIFNFKNILAGLLDGNGVLELKTNIRVEKAGITLALDSVRVKGLDSFSNVNVFEPIGPQTLNSSAQFSVLDLELLLSAGVSSSPVPPQLITARFAVQNVSAAIAIFAAFDLDKLGNLEVGSLLDTVSIIKCILYAAYAFDIPQMKVTVGSFSNPSVQGFMSDTEAVATRSIDAVFNQCQSVIEEAIPIIFDGVGKEMIASLLSSVNGSTCSSTVRNVPNINFIDFRDLLLPGNEAILLGGSDKSPYGNLVSHFFGLINDKLFVADPATGLAAIYRKLIAPLAQAQSGTPGRLFFPGDIFNKGHSIHAGGLNADIWLRLYNASINNLDSVGVPLTILAPVKGEAY